MLSPVLMCLPAVASIAELLGKVVSPLPLMFCDVEMVVHSCACFIINCVQRLRISMGISIFVCPEVLACPLYNEAGMPRCAAP